MFNQTTGVVGILGYELCREQLCKLQKKKIYIEKLANNRDNVIIYMGKKAKPFVPGLSSLTSHYGCHSRKQPLQNNSSVN